MQTVTQCGNGYGRVNSPLLIVHALVSVCMIYVVCTVIDQVRIWVVEKPFFKVLEKWGI